MIINKEVIGGLNPCKDRFDNFVKFYGDKDFTVAKFMGLKNITQEDKLWVVFRLMPKDSIRLAAADIAESVLHIFENKYPNDCRPRKAIEAARCGNKVTADAAAAAAYAAAATAAARAAAYADAAAAAAYAAAATAADAAAADADAAAADAARAAATAAATAADARSTQEKLIRKICMKYLRNGR